MEEAQLSKSKNEELMIEAKGFFDFYKKELGESLRKGKNTIFLDFMKLLEYSNKLAEEILVNPEENIRVLELAIEEKGLIENVRARLLNLPKSQEIKIRNLRSRNLNEIVVVEGIVRQASDVRPQVVNAKFECPSCGTVLSVLQIEKKFREPMRCSCGRRGNFKLISKEMVDTQRLVIEEAPETLTGGEQPKRINIFLKEDLVEPNMEEKTTPGSRVKVMGILKEVPVPLQSGGLSTRFELALEANNIIPLEETFEELDINDEDERQILELSQDPKVFEKLTRSIIPSVWGYDEIKRCLILQLFGGVEKIHADGQRSRGDIHILLIGDPGVAKSATLNFMAKISPKGRYVVGKSATGAGLTATVVRDEYLRGWSLEAGSMVLANRGLLCIDELEKMDPGDRSTMHEAMEQQCYHHDTIITLSDGSERKIGELVEEILEKNKEKAINGKDCLILPVENLEILTTDFNTIHKTRIDRISKHKAFEKFVKIKFSHGREIIVTPEHPVFFAKGGEIVTKRADEAKIGDSIPIPLSMPIPGRDQNFLIPEINKRSKQHIKIPDKNSEEIFKIAGYLISEGSREKNRGKLIGINFTNKDQRVLDDFEKSMLTKFALSPYKQARVDDNGLRYCYRYVSKELAEFFRINLPEILNISEKKAIPQLLMKGKKENISKMLSCLFEGDGYVSIKNRTIRIGYKTKSKRLSEQVQDLLLRFGIRSSITENRGFYRIGVTSYENLKKFFNEIKFVTKEKNFIINKYLEEKNIRRHVKDRIPIEFNDSIIRIIKEENIGKVGKYSLYDVIYDHSKRKDKFAFSLEFLNNLFPLLKEDKNRQYVGRLIGDIGWEKVIGIEIIDNEEEKWVYDVTIEPSHSFVSQATILHNTVTISKANVHACYSEDTEVLTESGWRKYHEVGGLKIAQYNSLDNTIRFLPHKGLYVYDYYGKMYHFKNKRNDMLVTPNHTMFLKREKSKKYEKINAEDITSNKIKVLNSGEYIGEEEEFFILPAIKHKQNRKHPKYTHQHRDKKIPMDLWLEFLGYYVTEGGVETFPTIGIVQKKGEKAEKIKRCLKNLTNTLGCSLSEIGAGKYTRFKITQTQLYEHLKQHGERVHLKKLGLNFSELSKKQLKILYDAMMVGDGSSDGKYLSSTSKKLAEEVQIIAHLIGKSASQNIHYKEGLRGNRKTAYRVIFSERKELMIKRSSIKKTDYDGKVFCFSTQTGFFVTRRNGKIAIQGNTLRAETSVLAAANPKFGRFDPFQSIAQQIDLPPTLINRFDVIFPLRDLPNREKDELIAIHVLHEHQKMGEEMLISKELLRKYVAYAKQRIKPTLSDEAVEEIKKFYVELRNTPISVEGIVRPIPISARQLQALIRMSEASAKMRLSETVDSGDAKRAIEIMKYYLMQVGYDYESKTFDIDRGTGGMPASQRNKVFIVRDVITQLESRLGKMIPIEEIEKELEGKLTKDEIEEAITKLDVSGVIFRPRRGYVGRT